MSTVFDFTRGTLRRFHIYPQVAATNKVLLNSGSSDSILLRYNGRIFGVGFNQNRVLATLFIHLLYMLVFYSKLDLNFSHYTFFLGELTSMVSITPEF